MARERVNPPVEALYERKWKIFAVMMIGWAMSLIDSSIVNIAVPELQQDLDTDIDTVTWVINAYNIVFAVLLVAMGRLADQFGRRRFFILGMALFTLGSGLCAAAWDIDSLIAFRVVQGAGAGMLAPLGFAITALVFPPAERGKALATIAVVALVSTAVGPVLGGAILEIADWQWIFLINLPFGFLGIALARRIWLETYDLAASGRKPDWVGMTLLGLALFCLTFSLAEANKRGWDDALILFMLQGSVLLAIAFYFSQRLGRNPMITRALMGNRQFTGANTAMVLFGAGALGALFLISLVFQSLWGYDHWEAALLLVPVPLMGLLVWPVVGKGANTRPPRQLAVPALFAMAIGLVWFSFIPSTSESWTDYAIVLPGLLLIGIGMGTIFPTINVGAMGAVTGPELGLASGILNTARQLGAAVGIALLTATLSVAAHWTLGYAQQDLVNLNRSYNLPPAAVQEITGHTFADFLGRSPERLDRRVGFDQESAREMAGAARDAYGWGFRIAALLVFAAIPFARTMRLHPGAARQKPAAAAGPPPDPEEGLQPAGARMAVAGGVAVPAGGGAQGSAPQQLEGRVAELEGLLARLREQVDEGGGGDWIEPTSNPRREARRASAGRPSAEPPPVEPGDPLGEPEEPPDDASWDDEGADEHEDDGRPSEVEEPAPWDTSAEQRARRRQHTRRRRGVFRRRR